MNTAIQYTSEILKAKYVRLGLAPTGINTNRYVLEQEVYLDPYDSKAVSAIITDPMVFFVELIGQGMRLVLRDDGQIIDAERPDHLQLTFDLMDNIAIVKRLIDGEVELPSSGDYDHVMHMNRSMEGTFSELRLPIDPKVAFWDLQIIPPNDNEYGNTARLCLDLPYHGKIKEAVLKRESERKERELAQEAEIYASREDHRQRSVGEAGQPQTSQAWPPTASQPFPARTSLG
jgi:hypothetical protein